MNIEARRLTKRYGPLAALDGIDLDIASGERVGLVGPNGSGKSTLVRAIMGIVRCEGVVLLNGLDPFEQRASLAAHVACVPQTAPQLGATVGAVMHAVASLRNLAVAEIRHTAHRLDLDVDALQRRPVRALSGGTKQKLLIALALAGPVSLLILDEPTASLDTDAREAFFRLFDERAGRATLLLSSHRPDEVHRLVDRVVALEAGRVALDVRAAQLAAQAQFNRDPKSRTVERMLAGTDGLLA